MQNIVDKGLLSKYHLPGTWHPPEKDVFHFFFQTHVQGIRVSAYLSAIARCVSLHLVFSNDIRSEMSFLMG